MQGMPAFWAPAGPQPRRLTWGRGPKKSSPKRAARKPARKRKRNKTQKIAAFCGWGRAHTRQKARKPTGKKQGLHSARASHSKSKTDRTTAQRSAQQFLKVSTAFCRARAASPACPAALGAKMRENEPRLSPSDTFLKTVLHGLRGFLEGSLDDAGQAPLKHRPGPTPDPDDVSHMA